MKPHDGWFLWKFLPLFILCHVTIGQPWYQPFWVATSVRLKMPSIVAFAAIFSLHMNIHNLKFSIIQFVNDFDAKCFRKCALKTCIKNHCLGFLCRIKATKWFPSGSYLNVPACALISLWDPSLKLSFWSRKLDFKRRNYVFITKGRCYSFLIGKYHYFSNSN